MSEPNEKTCGACGQPYDPANADAAGHHSPTSCEVALDEGAAEQPDQCFECGREPEPFETFAQFEAETNTSYPDGKLETVSICKDCAPPAPEKKPAPEKLPVVKLLGADGNAFSVLGLCKRAADKAKWSKERWQAFRDEATSGDYNKLLGAAMTHFDVR